MHSHEWPLANDAFNPSPGFMLITASADAAIPDEGSKEAIPV